MAVWNDFGKGCVRKWHPDGWVSATGIWGWPGAAGEWLGSSSGVVWGKCLPSVGKSLPLLSGGGTASSALQVAVSSPPPAAEPVQEL